MIREEKFQSVAEHYLELLHIVKDYPDILEIWKNKSAVATNHSSRRPVPETGDFEVSRNHD